MGVDPEDARRLATRSGGNPFTLLQYLRAIIDAGLDDAAIAAVMGGNVRRLLDDVLPA